MNDDDNDLFFHNVELHAKSPEIHRALFFVVDVSHLSRVTFNSAVRNVHYGAISR